MSIKNHNPIPFAPVVRAVCLSVAVSTLAMSPAAWSQPIVPGVSGASYTYNSVRHAYFITGNTSLDTDISGTDILVGKNNPASYTTLPAIAGNDTFTVNAGSTTTSFGSNYPDSIPQLGSGFPGYELALNTFGSWQTKIYGGSVYYARSYDSASTNIYGGSVQFASSGYWGEASGDSTLNIYDGFVHRPDSSGFGVLNIYGGIQDSVLSTSTRPTNIHGGRINSGIYLFYMSGTDGVSTKANIYGSNLAATYAGFDGRYDIFNITGTLQDGTVYGGAYAPLKINILNAVFNTTGDSTLRDIMFNDMNPVLIPEIPSAMLLLVGMPLATAAVLRSRKNRSRSTDR